MTAGTWFVLCDRARAIALDDLARQIAPLPHVTVDVSDELLRATVHDPRSGQDADILVGLSTEPHVVNESAEIAEFHGADRGDRAAIAAANARYEINWDPEFRYEVYNTLAVIAEKLETATGGAIFNTEASEFV